MAPLLSVRDLHTRFHTKRGVATAVDHVSFDLAAGEFLGIVGESGSGKSVTALSLLRLIASPPGEIVGGEVSFAGQNLLALSEGALRHIRGNDIAMIFQEPMTSLNPIYTVGDQIMESLIQHLRLSRRAARDRAIELLDQVGITSPAQRVQEYPHQLSGGMRQRVMIAMAISCNPQILIADEPTTALDVTIQAQILDQLRALQQELGLAVILITHDLGVIAEFVSRVLVMYAGRVVEESPVAPLFAQPLHPYAQGLLQSIPQIDRDMERLESIDGVVPSPFDMPPGCAFAPRCRQVMDACRVAPPDLRAAGPDRRAACLRLNEPADTAR